MTGDNTELPRKPATTQVPIHDLLAARWSPRAFDATRAVTREQIIALIEAARWAPSCFGNEPWRFLMWDRAVDDAGWQRAFACLSAGNQPWVKNVPLLFAAIAHPTFDHNGKPNRWAQYDTGAASENLVLQAAALGLAAHQMGGFDVDRLRAEFAIPEECTPMAMIAVGHQASPDVLAEEQRVKELAQRARKLRATRFFAGRWGIPLE
ncbi:MAG: nitroreductase family protein [Burkholderiales bacterium]